MRNRVTKPRINITTAASTKKQLNDLIDSLFMEIKSRDKIIEKQKETIKEFEEKEKKYAAQKAGKAKTG